MFLPVRLQRELDAHIVLHPTANRNTKRNNPRLVAYSLQPSRVISFGWWVPSVVNLAFYGFGETLRRCASSNLTTVYRKLRAGAIHPQPSLLGTVHKCCPGILFNHTKKKKFCIRPGQNRVFAAYQLRGLLQNRQRRQKGVHKMFTFQAGQNRIFAAYQVREKFF